MTISAEGSGAIGADVARENAAAKKALRTWGKAATRACRKSYRRLKPLERELSSKAMWRNPSRADVVSFGRRVASFAKSAEYEYDLLRDIALPTEPGAVDAIDAFFQNEEEALMLIQRVGIEFTELNDIGAILRTVKRYNRLEDDYKRTARAVHAGACYHK